MPQCPRCGAHAQGRFCAACGSPLPAETAAPPPPSPGPPPLAAAGLTENAAAALCYALGVLTGVLFLVLEPYNRNRTIRFHAFQSIFFWVAVVVASIAMTILANLIAWLPYVGWIVVLMLWPVFGLGALAMWVMLMYKAYNNQRWVLPLIGPIAEKQA